MADTLTLTIRLHDPKEKTKAHLSASWLRVEVERVDVQLPDDAFAAKYVTPNLAQLTVLRPPAEK